MVNAPWFRSPISPSIPSTPARALPRTLPWFRSLPPRCCPSWRDLACLFAAAAKTSRTAKHENHFAAVGGSSFRQFRIRVGRILREGPQGDPLHGGRLQGGLPFSGDPLAARGLQARGKAVQGGGLRNGQ